MSVSIGVVTHAVLPVPYLRAGLCFRVGQRHCEICKIANWLPSRRGCLNGGGWHDGTSTPHGAYRPSTRAIPVAGPQGGADMRIVNVGFGIWSVPRADVETSRASGGAVFGLNGSPAGGACNRDVGRGVVAGRTGGHIAFSFCTSVLSTVGDATPHAARRRPPLNSMFVFTRPRSNQLTYLSARLH